MFGRERTGAGVRGRLASGPGLSVAGRWLRRTRGRSVGEGSWAAGHAGSVGSLGWADARVMEGGIRVVSTVGRKTR